MSKKNIIAPVIALGAVATVGVITTTAHADTVTNSTATPTPVSDQASQQLANLKSQQAQSEQEMSTSNAATMSAANASAASQIAGLSQQINSLQASDVAAHSAAIASQVVNAQSAASQSVASENARYDSALSSQKAANSVELASAQAHIVTPAQKQAQASQENASFAKASDALLQGHGQKLDTINANYQKSSTAVQNELDQAQKDTEQNHQDTVKNATQQIDGQINDANNAVKFAQDIIVTANNDINAKQDALNKANNDYAQAQSKLNQDQSALNDAKTALNNSQDVQTTDKLNVPADYIAVWKTYAQKYHDWLLTKSIDADLWQRNHDDSIQAEKMNQDFVASAHDKATPIHFQSDGTLDRNAAVIATQYAAELLNPIRQAIGMNPYQITNASIAMNMENASKYRAKGHDDWKDSHDHDLLNQIATEWGVDAMGESLAGNWDLAEAKNPTVATLKKAVFQAVIALLFEGTDPNSDMGHTTDLLGVRYANGSAYLGGSDLLGVTFDIDPVNHNGWVRFNSIADGHGAHTKFMHDNNFVGVNSGTSKDKSIQGSNYDHIAVPTPVAESSNPSKLQAQIDSLTKQVKTDNAAFNQATDKKTKAEGELFAAKNRLAQDRDALDKVQSKLSDLQQNRDKLIQQLVGNTPQPKHIEDLQSQLNELQSAYHHSVLNENNAYAESLHKLQQSHADKLASIAAQPENVDALKSQQAQKLAALKKDHEDKLVKINAEMQAQIAAIRQQAMPNDPAIADLQVRIDSIKSNLKEQQQALDDQYNALVAKDKTDYDALAQKLASSSSEVVKGHNDHYTTSDGHVVTLPESKTNSNTKAATDSVKGTAKNTVKNTVTAPAVKPEQVQSQARNEARNINVTASVASATMIAEKGTNQTQHGKRLPQTGNVNSILAMAFGLMLAMLGIGIAENKKRN